MFVQTAILSSQLRENVWLRLFLIRSCALRFMGRMAPAKLRSCSFLEAVVHYPSCQQFGTVIKWPMLRIWHCPLFAKEKTVAWNGFVFSLFVLAAHQSKNDYVRERSRIQVEWSIQISFIADSFHSLVAQQPWSVDSSTSGLPLMLRGRKYNSHDLFGLPMICVRVVFDVFLFFFIHC